MCTRDAGVEQQTVNFNAEMSCVRDEWTMRVESQALKFNGSLAVMGMEGPRDGR